MTNPKSRMFAAVAGALSMGAVAAWAAEPTPTDLKIQELQAKVSQLEARQAANSKDMAATIDAVLRDAEHRSQLLAASGDMGAGYDGGFFIKAGDNWVLRPGVLFQFWNVTDWREDVSDVSGGEPEDSLDNGFEVHKLFLQLEGTAFTKDLTYSFIWDTSPSGGSLSLLDAWAKYMFADEWGVRMGQYTDPVSHEDLMYDGFLMAAERSMTSMFFSTGRVQGVSLIYGNYNAKNPINAEVAFTDGANSINTDFTDTNGNFGVAGRVEYKAMGNWLNYRDFSAMGNKEDLLVFGLGGDWTQFGDSNGLLGTLDGQYEMANGLSLYGAGYLRYLDNDISTISGKDTTDWGFVAQAGYMLNPSWELFGRADYLRPDSKTVAPASGDEQDFWELTVGVNYFLGSNGSAGHRAKFTVDLTWLPDGTPESLHSMGIGAADDTSGQNEFMLRAQFQLLI